MRCLAERYADEVAPASAIGELTHADRTAIILPEQNIRNSYGDGTRALAVVDRRVGVRHELTIHGMSLALT